MLSGAGQPGDARRESAAAAPDGPEIRASVSRKSFSVMFRLPENIALADAALFGGQPMAGGDIFDIDEIHPGIDIAGHPAVQEIHDHFAGRAWV